MPHYRTRRCCDKIWRCPSWQCPAWQCPNWRCSAWHCPSQQHFSPFGHSGVCTADCKQARLALTASSGPSRCPCVGGGVAHTHTDGHKFRLQLKSQVLAFNHILSKRSRIHCSLPAVAFTAHAQRKLMYMQYCNVVFVTLQLYMCSAAR